jgi:HSP90 family molecular chaperone
MGRGNYLPPVPKYEEDNVHVKYEMVYIDILDLVADYEGDPNAYQYVYDEIILIFKDCFTEKYLSFEEVIAEEYLDDNVSRVILENELCMVTIADDVDKCAVSVIAKEDENNPEFVKISNRMIKTYGKHLKETALKYYGKYSTWVSPCKTGEVRKEDLVSA